MTHLIDLHLDFKLTKTDIQHIVMSLTHLTNELYTNIVSNTNLTHKMHY